MNHLYTIFVVALAMTSLQAESENPSAAPPATNPVPILLKVSDGVKAGRSFSINGEGLEAVAVSVALAPDTTGQSPAVPPAHAIYPPIIQTDKDGHFVVVRLPAGSSPGVYDVWVANSQGWSACAKLNAARALFMSDYQAYNGLDIEVVGRNFDQSEFGGPTATKVRLNNGSGTTYNLPVKDLNPYHLTFTVGNQPVGTYFVEVSNDGLNWSKVASGQTLTLLATPPAGSDPLGLGVSWAKDFKWANVFNVTNYGANPNDLGDDTIAVQNAVNAAENSGGGVVYFPNGSYYLKNINLGSGVVLEGQDEYHTKLYYSATDGRDFIYTKDIACHGGIPQLQGVTRLSILLSNPTNILDRPDVFIDLGQRWSTEAKSDLTRRTANRLFIASVDLDYLYTSGDSSAADGRRGIGALWIGKERVLLKDNHFTGWGANNIVTFLGQYCVFKNNRFEFSSGYVHDTATYLFYEDNYIKVHPEFNQDSHGYFARADAYMAGNYVEGAGDAANINNDGEALCTEVPGATFNFGAVLNSTSNSLTVATVIPLVNPMVEFGNLSIAITTGTGLGQVKTVAFINTNAGVIVLSRPFEVIPDATSKFTLYAPLAYFTVYSNTLVNCAKGIWGFGNQYDTVVADNISIDCNGILIWSARGIYDWTSGNITTKGAQDCPDFFQRITRNTIIGVSRRSNQGGIGTYTGRFDGPKFYDVEVYATEITDNCVSGNNAIPAGSGTEAPPYDGLYVSSYPFSTGADGTGTGDATETLMESNRLSNLPTGVILTKLDYGQLVNGNSYDSSVLTFLKNTTQSTDNTLITSNALVTGTSLPEITTQPQDQSVLTNETTTFTVLATGLPAPFYQWRKNNVAIAGANRASYTLPPVTRGDNGSQFSIILSNSTGSTISSNASLTVSTTSSRP